VLVPFSRPLPGGEPFSFDTTPEIGCRAPLVGMFGDDRPVADVYTLPRPSEGDRVEERQVACTGQARFRVALGSLLAAASIVMAVRGRRLDIGQPR
ncbi:uncharacterized protein METZ01_LOCUS481248, partial [marine metagenome]